MSSLFSLLMSNPNIKRVNIPHNLPENDKKFRTLYNNISFVNEYINDDKKNIEKYTDLLTKDTNDYNNLIKQMKELLDVFELDYNDDATHEQLYKIYLDGIENKKKRDAEQLLLKKKNDSDFLLKRIEQLESEINELKNKSNN